MAGLLAKPEIVGAAREDLAIQDLKTMFGFDALAFEIQFAAQFLLGEHFRPQNDDFWLHRNR